MKNNMSNKSYKLNDSKLSVYIYIKLKFWKNKRLSNERKKFMFENINIAGAYRRLFETCHWAPLKVK